MRLLYIISILASHILSSLFLMIWYFSSTSIILWMLFAASAVSSALFFLLYRYRRSTDNKEYIAFGFAFLLAFVFYLYIGRLSPFMADRWTIILTLLLIFSCVTTGIVKRNPFFGVKIPSAYLSEEIWRKINTTTSIFMSFFILPLFLLCFHIVLSGHYLGTIILLFAIFISSFAGWLYTRKDILKHKRKEDGYVPRS